MTNPTPAPLSPKESAIAEQRVVFEILREELGAGSTWADLGRALGVKQVRISQWRATKGMRLDTILGVMKAWNDFVDGPLAGESRKALWAITADGCTIEFKRPRGGFRVG